MAPETRSQDVRRMDDSLEAANQRVNGIEVKLHAQSDDLAQLKAMMKEMANQQISIKQTLQILACEASSSQNVQMPQHPAPASNQEWIGEGPPTYRSRRPEEISLLLKGKKYINGCTNATSISTWKKSLKRTS